MNSLISEQMPKMRHSSVGVCVCVLTPDVGGYDI